MSRKTVELNTEYRGVLVLISADYNSGCIGTYFDPPEPAFLQDVMVCDANDADITSMCDLDEIEKLIFKEIECLADLDSSY